MTFKKLVTRLCSLAITAPLPVAGAFLNSNAPLVAFRRQHGSRQRCWNMNRLLAAAAKGGSAQHQQNEFSRIIRPDRILRTRRADYRIEVEADLDERRALAGRFDLEAIDRLVASLSLRQERSSSTDRSTDGSVEVEGTVLASVTQTCVRTNEQFQVDLEFPLYCIVRPVASMGSLLAQQQQRQRENGRNDSDSKSSSPQSSHRKKDGRRNVSSINDMDVMELQRLLQADISADDDVLIEDDAIYALETGVLDVGELVSQLFWLELDPYPKKPGTDPIQTSITG